jgi:hypothetical protein
MNPPSPNPAEIDALLRLLDDDTPVVRERVAERLGSCGGDLSAWFANHPRQLSVTETEVLTRILRPAKRQTLARRWQRAITDGAKAETLDWDEAERLLDLLAGFLHDGITPRPELTDALDALAAAARGAGVGDGMELRKHLFETMAFNGNEEGYHDPRNCDLAWSIHERRSNPIGLCLIFILVGRRLDIRVDGVAFPGHYLCRIFPQGVPIIVDCFNGGQVHFQDIMLEPDSGLSRQDRAMIRLAATPGTSLVRVLNNLAGALQATHREEDFNLIQRLRVMLEG